MNYTKPLKVALTYNLKKKPDEGLLPQDFYSEFDSQETIGAIRDALVAGGNELSLVEADGRLLEWFTKNRPDIVFNIAEGDKGAGREAQVPAILDYLAIPYTGSGVTALCMALDKSAAKKIFRYEKIPTPDFQLFRDTSEGLNPSLRFPLIVKPNAEGSAKGIDRTSVVKDERSLYEKIGHIISLYRQPALVEEFIDGVELTVGLLGNGEGLRVLGVMEIDFTKCIEAGEFFYTWLVKAYENDPASGHLRTIYYCPARLPDELMKAVETTAVRAHRALGCDDFSRVDIRLSKDNIPYVLEVNPLPGLSPHDSNFPFIGTSGGMSYNELINKMLEAGLERWRAKLNGAPSDSKGGKKVECGQLQAH